MTKAKTPTAKAPKNSLLTNWLKKADKSKESSNEHALANPSVKEKDLGKENIHDRNKTQLFDKKPTTVQSKQKNELNFKVPTPVWSTADETLRPMARSFVTCLNCRLCLAQILEYRQKLFFVSSQYILLCAVLPASCSITTTMSTFVLTW